MSLANFGDKRKVNPPGEPIPRIHAWCYICQSEHRWNEPHWWEVATVIDTASCAYCGKTFVPGPRRSVYCDPECRYQSKLRRRRVTERISRTRQGIPAGTIRKP